MISRITGEAKFRDLLIAPQATVPSALAKKSRALPIPGWSGYQLGVHHSEIGAFDIEVLTDADGRIQLLLLAHLHPFYKSDTSDDAERRAFHEGLSRNHAVGFYF